MSAGFDAAQGDPIGECKVTPAGYASMTHMLCSLAGGRVVVALEGGYSLTAIADSALGCFSVLRGCPPIIPKQTIPAAHAVETIREVKQHQAKHWKCFQHTM